MQARTMRRWIYVVTSTLMLGCGAEAPLLVEPQALTAARFASDTDPRARWELHGVLSDGVTAAKITGDGRDIGGNTSGDGSSQYQGRLCGVHAKIFVVGGTSAGSGDAVLDPDAERSRCPGGARYVAVDVGAGEVQTGPLTNAMAIDQMSAGATKLQAMRWGVGLGGCERLVFENVRVTRTDTAPPRTWSVETTGDHAAACENRAKGGYVATGATHVVPFRATITEVLP